MDRTAAQLKPFPAFCQFSRKIVGLIPVQWSHTESVVEMACKYYTEAGVLLGVTVC